MSGLTDSISWTDVNAYTTGRSELPVSAVALREMPINKYARDLNIGKVDRALLKHFYWS
jgi:hypothetical protein